MGYVPDSRTLNGWSYAKASCMGMPHFGARYLAGRPTRRGSRRCGLVTGARCAACGAVATNAHHEPPRGQGGASETFAMRTEWGTFVLRPALIALCGSGTTGCHGMRHAGLLTIRWEWDTDRAAEAWWSGLLLSRGLEPHDPRLYRLGRWVVSGGDFGIEVRGGR